MGTANTKISLSSSEKLMLVKYQWLDAVDQVSGTPECCLAQVPATLVWVWGLLEYLIKINTGQESVLARTPGHLPLLWLTLPIWSKLLIPIYILLRLKANTAQGYFFTEASLFRAKWNFTCLMKNGNWVMTCKYIKGDSLDWVSIWSLTPLSITSEPQGVKQGWKTAKEFTCWTKSVRNSAT